MSDSKRITVIGLGNLLCGDDAFGVHTAEKLFSQYDFPPNVDIIDGGSQGPTLCGFVEESRKLLVIDAVDYDLPPYTLKVFDKAETPVWIGMRKVSAHQNSFAETLALASLRGHLPEEICLIGMQKGATDFGAEMSASARMQVAPAIQLALGILSRWQIGFSPRKHPRHLVNAEMRKKIY